MSYRREKKVCVVKLQDELHVCTTCIAVCSSPQSLRSPELRDAALQEWWMEQCPDTRLPLSLPLGNKAGLISVELCLTIAWRAYSLLGLLSPLSNLKLVQEQKSVRKPAMADSVGIGQFVAAQRWWEPAASDTSLPFFLLLPFVLFLCNVLSLLPFFPLLQHILPLLTLIPFCFWCQRLQWLSWW